MMKRIYFCAIAAFSAAVFVPGCSNFGGKKDGQTAKHWGEVRSQIKLQLARQQYEQGLVDESIEFIQESLGWNPNSGEAHLLLAKCYLEQDKISAAHRAAQKASETMVDSSELASIQGTIAERMGQYGMAVNHYHRARMIDDTVVEYLMSEAECLVSSGKPEQARALLVSRVMDYGNDPSIHALLGEIALHVGDRESALESFSVALDAGRLDPVMTEEYALLAVEMKRYGEALAVLEPMLTDRKKAASGSIVRASAKCMLELERMEEAKELLRDHLSRDHDDLEAWYLLARAGIVSGDLMTTRRSLSAVKRLAPNSPQTLLFDAYTNLRTGRYRSAEESLETLLTYNHEDVLVHCLLGVTAERANDFSRAREHYQKALEIDGDCNWAQAALRKLSVNKKAVG